MEPQARIERQRPVLIGTILILLAGFVFLIILFIGFTSLLPSFMGRCVAVVNIDQEITTAGTQASLFSNGYPGSEELASDISALNQRDDVGAVVFVMNSPGGSVVATREIYSAVKGLDKPRVAYFREIAASGAYYIASGTDYIVSDPDAITGSIGVIATYSDMSGLFDRLGINVTDITSGSHKDMGTYSRPLTEEERNITQALVDEVFNEFRQTVVDNRGSKLDQALFNQILDARILSGRQAQKVGLVDETGSKMDAIKKAADMAGIEYSDPSEIRICDVQTVTPGGSLFGAESLARALGLDSGSPPPSLSYR